MLHVAIAVVKLVQPNMERYHSKMIISSYKTAERLTIYTLTILILQWQY